MRPIAIMPFVFPVALLAAGSGDSTRTDTVAKPAMELGGLVTADLYADTLRGASRGDSLNNPHFEIGRVELGATINLGDEVIAAITIRAEGNLHDMYIREAMAEYKPKSMPLTFIFGQHQLNHGLLTTRIVTDPLILPEVELVTPALCLGYTIGGWATPGAALTVVKVTDDSGATVARDFAGVLDLDLALPEDSRVRISSLLARHTIDLDLAARLSVWKGTIDAELWGQLRSNRDNLESGYYAGVNLDVTDRLSVAVRHDGLSENGFQEMTLRFAGCLTFSIANGIFAALEVAHAVPRGAWDRGFQEVYLEVGLQQKLQLPGFQRKTLATE